MSSKSRVRLGCLRVFVTIAALGLLGLTALVGYVAFGGPRLSADTDRVIDEVLSGEVRSVLRGASGYAHSGHIKLWYEDIPPVVPERGTVLLLMGMGSDALMWPRAFIDVFLDAGFRVVRYDQRGTGLSDWMEAWEPEHAYSLTDLTTDALAILDHLEIARAHLCGLSLGGMVAQELAIQHPARVASLVLVSTSPDVTDETLPTLSTGYLLKTVWESLPLLRYRIAGGERNLIKERVAKFAMVEPNLSPESVREIAEDVLYDVRFRRGVHASAVVQHQRAAAISRKRGALLAELQVPTLVVHGEEDPILPIAHGRRLAETIPSARALFLPNEGHVLLYPPRPVVTRAIVDHMRTASE